MGQAALVEDGAPCQKGLVWEEIALKKDTFLKNFGGEKMFFFQKCPKITKKVFWGFLSHFENILFGGGLWMILSQFGSPCSSNAGRGGGKSPPSYPSSPEYWHSPPFLPCCCPATERTKVIPFPSHECTMFPSFYAVAKGNKGFSLTLKEVRKALARYSIARFPFSSFPPLLFRASEGKPRVVCPQSP